MIKLCALIFFCIFLPQTTGHGRLIEPPSRASAWRYGFDTPHNYNDHESYCGGFTRQWVKNEGKCGVCGDAWDIKPPRPHEYGGTYGQGVIVRNYSVGGLITIRVELTASHMGYFQFGVCPNYKHTTQECLQEHLLRMVRPQDNVDKGFTRYYPKDGNKVYEMRFRLPKMNCRHCVLQWRYVSGNNWGDCKNGTEAIGCGAQEEFRACADISISGEAPAMPEPTTGISVTTPSLLPEPEESYSPAITVVIIIVALLAVCLLFLLVYCYYYEVGFLIRVKAWVRKSPRESVNHTKESRFTINNLSLVTPIAPPRTKRGVAKMVPEDNMHDIDLRDDSLA